VAGIEPASWLSAIGTPLAPHFNPAAPRELALSGEIGFLDRIYWKVSIVFCTMTCRRLWDANSAEEANHGSVFGNKKGSRDRRSSHKRAQTSE
jgi:hypothetical protein